MTLVAKITAKGQTTIPKKIRAVLKVKPGDLLVWEVGPKGRVEVRRVQPTDLEYLRALEGTMGEWETPEDEKAYRNL